MNSFFEILCYGKVRNWLIRHRRFRFWKIYRTNSRKICLKYAFCTMGRGKKWNDVARFPIFYLSRYFPISTVPIFCMQRIKKILVLLSFEGPQVLWVLSVLYVLTNINLLWKYRKELCKLLLHPLQLYVSTMCILIVLLCTQKWTWK